MIFKIKNSSSKETPGSYTQKSTHIFNKCFNLAKYSDCLSFSLLRCTASIIN